MAALPLEKALGVYLAGWNIYNEREVNVCYLIADMREGRNRTER